MVLLQRKLYFSKDPEGVQGGGGGSGPPIPPSGSALVPGYQFDHFCNAYLMLFLL